VTEWTSYRSGPGSDPAGLEGGIDHTDDQAALLVRMSAATIGRKLAGERATMMSRGRSHTKPGTLLKSQQ
jgi:hypothetical protein